MVKHFDPSCPKCSRRFHVHHDELRNAHVQLLCPYCGERFYAEQSASIIEHDGTVTKPQQGSK
jgi:predicted Zn finger-like uncharacterized protein